MVSVAGRYVSLYMSDANTELSIAPQLNQQLVPQHIRPRLQQQGLDFESPSFKPLTKDQMMARLD